MNMVTRTSTQSLPAARLVRYMDSPCVASSTSHDTLLLIDRRSFPLSYFVLPLLQQQDCAGSTGNSFGQERCDSGVEQRGIFRAIDKPGQITIVPG
jgi:hypothetical protein